MQMELLSGDLENLISKRHKILNDEEIIENWFKQLAQGIFYLHKNGIIHLDIKTKNILYSKDMNTLKLTDLGHSKQTNFESLYSVGNHGSILYLPPEIDITSILPKKYKSSFDIWCFGIVIYQILSKSDQNTFGFENLRETLKSKPNYLFEKLKGKNSKFLFVCNSCLQIKPEKRPKIEDVIKMLELPSNHSTFQSNCILQ